MKSTSTKHPCNMINSCEESSQTVFANEINAFKKQGNSTLGPTPYRGEAHLSRSSPSAALREARLACVVVEVPFEPLFGVRLRVEG